MQGRPGGQNRPPRPPRARHAGDWAPALSGDYPRANGACLAKRSRFPSFVSGAPADVGGSRLAALLSLPPQQQQRMLNRMETWEHLRRSETGSAGTVRQDAEASSRAPGVWLAVRCADLRAMPPGQRNRSSIANRFRGMFSPPGARLMRGATRLPLAPPENGKIRRTSGSRT